MKKDKIMLKDYGMTSSLSMADCHYLTSQGTFVCKGLPLHGKVLVIETSTPKLSEFEWGRPKQIFYLKLNPEKQFKTIKALIKFYNKVL